jgi:hypothetical protein
LSATDRFSIAARVRGLVAGQDAGDLAETAYRLGVEELALRMTIDETSPHPVIDVLTAVIAHYGVDPTWLLTGDYDAGTHRAAAEADHNATATALQRIADMHGGAGMGHLKLMRNAPTPPASSSASE